MYFVIPFLEFGVSGNRIAATIDPVLRQQGYAYVGVFLAARRHWASSWVVLN